MTGRKWLLAALSLFLALLVAWVAAAFLLSSASASSLPFSLRLRSKLQADYAAEESSGLLGVFRLSIIGDALRDRGLSPDEAAQQASEFELSMNDPVPTATARNFEGDPPYTPTATNTLVPSPTPTATVTNTPLPPTPKPTKTAKPTRPPKPSKTPKPTKTPGGSDNQEPQISGGNPSPTPSTICSGKFTINVNDIHVVDPAFSSGIDWVKLKYSVDGGSYKYSADLSPPVSGGWTAGPGSTWDAYYAGSITIDLDDYFSALPGGLGGLASLAPLTSGDYDIELWAKVRDLTGREDYVKIGDYEVPNSCWP